MMRKEAFAVLLLVVACEHGAAVESVVSGAYWTKLASCFRLLVVVNDSRILNT